MWIFLGPKKRQKDFLTTEVAKDTKIGRLDKGEGLNPKKNGFFLRALRALRGDIPFLVAALCRPRSFVAIYSGGLGP
jgi:hypothetical protein